MNLCVVPRVSDSHSNSKLLHNWLNSAMKSVHALQIAIAMWLYSCDRIHAAAVADEITHVNNTATLLAM